MAVEQRRKYTREFKQEAVRLVTEGGYGVEAAARNLEISAKMLGRWKKELSDQGEKAFPGQGHLMPEEEELQRLRRENTQLRRERDILKKATVFFAKESG